MSKDRFLMLAPAALVPPMGLGLIAIGAPDIVAGGVVGVLIGLSITAFLRNRRCAT